MSSLKIERLGGLAGFGGANLKSEGELDLSALPAADGAAIEALFADPPPAQSDAVADGFIYRITRVDKGSAHSIDVPEARAPAAIVDSVKDSFR